MLEADGEKVPSLIHPDDLSSSSDESGWMEFDDDETDDSDTTVCLFCSCNFKNVDLAMKHVKDNHGIDFLVLKSKFNMEQYSFIKMINYIRTHNIGADVIISAKACMWNDDKYLKPISYEPWLTFDYDYLDQKLVDEELDGDQLIHERLIHTELEDNILTLEQSIHEQSVYEELIHERSFHQHSICGKSIGGESIKSEQEQIRELREVIQKKDSLLQTYAADIKMLQNLVRVLSEYNDPEHNDPEHNDPEHNDPEHNDPEHKPSYKNVSVRHDDGYFETYDHFGIHHDMLSDEVRTRSYRDAIMNNETIFKDKNILDLGCGSSILSMFSSKAGAKKVISVDQSDIIYHAIEIVRKNKIKNIEFVKGRLEDINLPVDKVDIIVSEWMGYFLLFEGMLDSVIYAREHHLAPNGLLMPNRCKMFLLGHGDEDRHQHMISFWKNVYGFDMICLQREVLRETSIEVCNPKFVLTEPFLIADLDLMTVDLNYSNFKREFTLNVVTTGKLTSLIGYFDTFFELPHHVEFSTSPHATPTHWKQAVFYFKDAKIVHAGDVITGTLSCQRDPKNHRSLVIAIDMFGAIMKYNLN